MTFTAEPLPKYSRDPKTLKANYPFAHMKDNPGTGFVIPADKEKEFFAHCRVMASNYNKKHGTRITCNKMADGSLRVWNESTESKPQPQADLVPILEASIRAVEAKKETEQAPTKQQFISWFESSVKPGMSVTLGKEYAHRFYEFEQWIGEDMHGFDSEITYNPPSLKITRKA